MVANNPKTKKMTWFNSKILGTVLITKILGFCFAVQSYQIITDQPINSFYDYFGNWIPGRVTLFNYRSKQLCGDK